MGLLRVVDDRAEQVGDVLEERELEPLGVDEDDLDLLRRGLVEEAGDQGVEGDALARAGRAGDEQVGHDGQVGHDDAAVDVLAQGEGQLGGRVLEIRRLDDVAELDDLALVVGDLDAQGGLAGDALDADRLRLQGQGQVLGPALDLRDLDARGREVLVGRDDRSGVVLADLALDAELLELLLDAPFLVEELGLADLLGRKSDLEQVEVRVEVIALPAGIGEEQRLGLRRGDRLAGERDGRDGLAGRFLGQARRSSRSRSLSASFSALRAAFSDLGSGAAGGAAYLSRTFSRILSFSLAFWRSVTWIRTSLAVDSKAPLAKRRDLASDQRVEKRRKAASAARRKMNEPMVPRKRTRPLSSSSPSRPPAGTVLPRTGKDSKMRARSGQTTIRPSAIVPRRLSRWADEPRRTARRAA